MKPLNLAPPATIHLIGICGTGMGALAGLLKTRGYEVTGSDLHAYPPMSTELESLGITVMEGYRAANLDHSPDLVVVGNVCRPDHPEAMAARERGLAFASLPTTVRDLFLAEKKSIVVAGTHGKTTISSLTAFLLHETGRDPSFLIGGITGNFGTGYGIGAGEWFVIEGDEYDSAYFEKVPKFLSYVPKAAVITAVEHDHLDIYPTFEDYQAAFSAFAACVESPGPLAVYAGDRIALALAQKTTAAIVPYGLEGDAPSEEISWLARPLPNDRFELLTDGESRGRFSTPLKGRHNLRNTVAALCLCHLAAGVPLNALGEALPAFRGIKRRQEVLGRPGGVTVYDDFAHHPTAVQETIEALAPLHPAGRLLAAFEPRSATACRNIHQQRYARAFDAAGRAVIAPPGRDLPRSERLDTTRLAEEITRRGVPGTSANSIDQVLDQIISWARPGDGVVLLSNGGFGGLGRRLVEALG
jgi:UDP-N-acetylmuramate: L-alanyl-gamma-D-glutamyl-meso-diaminopimelate ligase